MIIKSLYIERFGGIADKRIDFQNSLNIICSENETGKSTIAEFIKIMLYGMGKSPQNIRGNERTRYMPWGEKRMGGEMTVSSDGNDFIIIRSFGKRKGDDTVSVVNALTGARENSLCTDMPGEILLGIGRDGFEKSLYIRQLSSRIEPDKDDEILKKLLNLAQSGDEGVSYKRAVQILDAASKDLCGVRPRGKMLVVEDKINELLSRRAEAAEKERTRRDLALRLDGLTAEKIKLEGFSADKSRLEVLNRRYSEALMKETAAKQAYNEKIRVNASRLKAALIQLVISVIATVAFIAFKPVLSIPFAVWAAVALVLPVLSIPFAVWAAVALVLYVKGRNKKTSPDMPESPEKILSLISDAENEIQQKERHNTSLLVETARQIGDVQNRLKSFENESTAEIDGKIAELQDKHRKYENYISDIALAKRCLQEAFDELQKSFGKRLNEETSLILKEITGGRYSEVLVDNDYNMLVRTQQNELHDAQYLSNGAYDQIYFALRMAIVNILFEDAPVILDEAFVQYDDSRLKLAFDYIKKTENRQILLFSCHQRECRLADTC